MTASQQYRKKPVFRDDGKVLKGPNYIEPDIASILATH